MSVHTSASTLFNHLSVLYLMHVFARRGSIVRISLQNFVTYTTAELRPSPQLNVIVGPNGSGKSSLVCAMVLGLGGKPAFLGRAKDAADYIKAGCDHAVIEIELYTGQGKNKVVRRDIYKDNSTWKIDGKPVRLKDIENLVRDFNIQVENLCSFLPQDRVVSFAALDSASLLKETGPCFCCMFNRRCVVH